MGVSAERVHAANARPVAVDGAYVLYWMIAARRAGHSFALDRAVDWARRLDRPLVVLEALRVAYPWASDRLHRFVLDGMRDNAEAFAGTDVRYLAYVEPRAGDGKGLLGALAARACVVVTDEFPCFFLPRMVASAARQVACLLETVDGNGLLPLAAADKAYPSAAHFRRIVQRELPKRLHHAPRARAWAGGGLPGRATLPRTLTRRWPMASAALLDGDARALAKLPIDHAVPPSPMRGGAREARARLRRFVGAPLDAYVEHRNHPDDDATSRLSPYLHFGHLSAHEIFAAVAAHEGWTPTRLAPRATGAREGFWGMSTGAEAFLDQLLVWRELGYNFCARRPDDYDRYESLPAWAQATLAAHAGDARPQSYTRRQLEEGQTHDPLWNAAMGQLRDEGWFHNYVRMLWGKKILEWSASPRAALATMIELMNRWSLDGRDPNSFSGYFWVLGRYDRPWPERAIYGQVRSMSSERTAKKVRIARYVERYAARR